MSYLSHDGLAYFKYKLANWVDANYLSKTSTGPLTVNGDVTFTQPIHGDIDGRAKKDWKGQQIDQTYVADIVAEDGALQLINGAGNVLKTVFDTTVTQKRSTANELYPLLLCYDASAEVDQLHKTVWFGSNVRSNPYYGYVALKGLYVQDSTNYNRRSGSPSTKKEWAIDFTDGVQGLGNPMAQVYEYVDTAANGGEHHIELRLYGNPNSSPEIPAANDTTNTIHIGVGMTKGGAAPNGAPVKFGYCPSTPIYADNGTSFRTVGTDIITRDWLTLNGSITGLVHTTMDEVIDGNKTFKKTVVINSGNNNSPAGLQVQGDTNISGNETVGGNLTVAGKTTTQTFESKGDATVDGDLLVKGDETVNGDETVKGDLGVQGVINKISGNTVKEYVTYVTEQPATRQNIAANLIDTSKGLKLYGTGTDKKIGVNAGPSLSFDSNGILDVDFDQMPTDKFEKLLQQLHLPLYVGERNGNQTIGANFYVDGRSNGPGVDTTNDAYGRSPEKPWKTVAYATQTLAKNYNISNKTVYLNVKGTTYNNTQSNGNWSGGVELPLLQRTTGRVIIRPYLDSNNNPETVNIYFTGDDSTTVFSHTGGVWELQHLNIRLTLTTQRSASATFPHIVSSTDSTGSLIIRNCNLSFVDNSVAADSSHGRYYARLVNATGGHIFICNNSSISADTTAGRKTTWSGTKGNAWVSWFYVENSGLIEMGRPGHGLVRSEIQVTGSFDFFIYCIFNSQYRLTGVGDDPIWTYNASSIGRGSQGYRAASGGTIITGAANVDAREDYFPRGKVADTSSNDLKSNYFATAEGSWISPGAGVTD